LVGMVGLLMMMEPLIRYVKFGFLDASALVVLSAGATIALLSKPEFAIGAVGALIATAACDARCLFKYTPLSDRLRHQAVLFALALLPALALYGLMAWKAGTKNLLAGITGYGMASLVCPWWPTGLGIAGAAVALLQ